MEKKKVSLPQPVMIAEYNAHMGGVDLLDNMLAVYRARIRKRKWWWCIWTWGLGVMMVNSWRLYNAVLVKRGGVKTQFLYFTRQVVVQMLKTHGEYRTRTGPSHRLSGPAKESIRADATNHWIVITEVKGVCQKCQKRSFYRYFTLHYITLHYYIVLVYCTY